MAFCSTCKKEVVPSITFGTLPMPGQPTKDAVVMTGAMHVCLDCSAPLKLGEPEQVIASVAQVGPRPSPTMTVTSVVTTAKDLPAAIRARKKELREIIKRSQRELAQLESLTKPSKKPATITALKRSAS